MPIKKKTVIDILLINSAALYITWTGTIQWDNNLQGILSFAIQDSSSLSSFNYNAVKCIYVGMIRQRLSNSWRTDSDVDVREVKQRVYVGDKNTEDVKAQSWYTTIKRQRSY